VQGKKEEDIEGKKEKEGERVRESCIKHVHRLAYQKPIRNS
jgi:hypothetical protein